MADNTHSSRPNWVVSGISILGCLLIFAAIMVVAYLPNRPDPVTQQLAVQRGATASESLAAQETTATTYGWVNQNEGIVRIPVERAMKITVEEMQQEQAAQGGPAR